MDQVLLTGATGYLGSKLAAALAARGPVAALKRRASNVDRLRGVTVRWHDAEDGIEPAFAAPVSWLIHAATSYGRAGESEAQVRAANFELPQRLLGAAVAARVPLFVNLDTALPAATNVYSRYKAGFRDAAIAARPPLRFVNLRLQHFYGPRDDASKFPTHVIRTCIANAVELALTPGEQRRDFLHVDDMVSAILAVIAHEHAAGPGYSDYDVGSGDAVTIRHFVERVKALSRSATRLNFGARDYRPGEPMLSVADPARLKALGWAPQLSLDEGLKNTIEGERAA